MDEKLRILLIEDDDHWLTLVGRMLAVVSKTHQLARIGSVGELANLEANNFDLIIADLGLPDSEGLETLGRIRQQMAGVPIIVLTGEDDEVLGRKAIGAGAADYIKKSELKPNLLSRAVYYALERGKLERRLLENSDQIAILERAITIERLAGGVAHEINNPLAIIKGLAFQLEKGIESGNLQLLQSGNVIPRIVNAVDRIASIVQSLMRISQSNQAMGPESVEVEELIHELYQEFKQSIEERGIQFKPHFDCHDQMVICSRLEITQALAAIIVNAVQALSSTTNPVIEVHCQVDHSGVEIRVSNNGPAIPAGLERKIFEPFFTTHPLGGGKGLGLAIARSLVQSNKGTLYLDCEADTTTFVIRLPASRTQPKKQNPAES